MSLETESVLDRRRLVRKASLWRGLAIVLAVVAIGAFLVSGDGRLGIADRKQIARIAVEGLITEDREQLKLLKRVAEADHVAGVIVYVNSPGGTTTGGEALFEALRRISERKPIVAQFGTVAASAAYITGLGTDHIVARGNTITGSVGVIMQWPEVSQLLGNWGIKVNEIKSGPLKAVPSPYQPTDEAGRRVVEQMVEDGQRWFLSLVAQRRNVATAEVPGLEQGRIYSGREALTLKLVDQIGGEAEAIKWLEDQRSVAKGLKVIDWKPGRGVDWGFDSEVGSFAGRAIAAAGRELSTALSADGALGALGLDGFVSVWQPSKN